MEQRLLVLAVVVGVSCLSGMRVVDLTHSLNSENQRWPTNIPFKLTVVANDTVGTEGWYASNDLTFSEHTGTHLDAPIHFALRPGTYQASSIPAERLVAPLHLVDLADKAAADRDYLVTAGDLTDWENKYGQIQEKSVVIFNFGWAQYWESFEQVFGSTSTDTTTFHFPGVGMEAAEILADRNVYGVGTDTPSVDYGPSQTFPVHGFLLEKNIYFLENVADMSELPEAAQGVTLFVGSMKIDGGSGSPARLLALVDSGITGSPTGAGYSVGGSCLLIVVMALIRMTLIC